MASRSLREEFGDEIVPAGAEDAKSRAARRRWRRPKVGSLNARKRAPRGTVLPILNNPERRRVATQALFSANRLVQDVGLDVADLAAVAHANPELVERWIDEGVPLPTASVTDRILDLDSIVRDLEGVLQPDSVSTWLRTAIPAFRGQTPIQMMSRGDAAPISDFVAGLKSAPTAG